MTDIYPEGLQAPPTPTEEELAILRRALVTKRTTLYLVGVMLFLILVGGFLLLLRANQTLMRADQTVTAIRAQQKVNSTIGRDTHDLVASFKDCVQPGGKCHQRNQRQTTKALIRVDAANRRVSAAAAACSLGVPDNLPQHQRYIQILRCTQQTVGQ